MTYWRNTKMKVEEIQFAPLWALRIALRIKELQREQNDGRNEGETKTSSIGTTQ